MLINIVFSIGDNSYYWDPSSNWMSFLINFSGVLIGAFLAFIIAIYIDRRQRKHEREEDYKKVVSLYNERLKHFTTLIDNVILIAEKQSKEYFDLSNKLVKNPYEQNLIDITLTNDIQRIKHLDDQKIFDAYTNALTSNKDMVENYTKLFHQIDFLDFKLTQIFDMHAKHINFTFNDQCYVRDIIDDLVAILTTIAVEIEDKLPEDYTNDKIYLFVTDLLSKNSKNCNLGFACFKREFIVPLRDNCREKFSFNKGWANLVFDKTKRAITRLEQIKVNSLDHSKKCRILKNEIEPTILKLKESNDEIKINLL